MRVFKHLSNGKTCIGARDLIRVATCGKSPTERTTSYCCLFFFCFFFTVRGRRLHATSSTPYDRDTKKAHEQPTLKALRTIIHGMRLHVTSSTPSTVTERDAIQTNPPHYAAGVCALHPVPQPTVTKKRLTIQPTLIFRTFSPATARCHRLSCNKKPMQAARVAPQAAALPPAHGGGERGRDSRRVNPGFAEAPLGVRGGGGVGHRGAGVVSGQKPGEVHEDGDAPDADIHEAS